MHSRLIQNLETFPFAEHLHDSQLGKPSAFTWRDYLLMLLKIDAGIEHALMVQYLYAAYSLGGSQVPEDKRKMVRKWQQTILSIAKEEMGHLITVQNVITCLGGSISLDREDYPWDHKFYPFPFELEPLTLDSLAKYVYTEAPIGWGEKDDQDEVLQRLQKRPIPPNPNVNSVAALFKVILAILKDPNKLSDDDFQADTFSQQASWGAWACNHGEVSGLDAPFHLAPDNPPSPKPAHTCPTTADVIVVPVSNRDEVIDALEQIAEQGEAAHSSDEQSHFRRFLRIYREFKAHFPNGLQPARNLPINPTTFHDEGKVSGDSYRKTTTITHPESIKWADLFNLRYRLLLTYLSHSFRLARALNPNKSPGNYQSVLHRAFCEMYNLKAISGILVRQPLHENPAPDTPFQPAGPPFQMPYNVELPENAISCWLQYRDILHACKDLREQLLKHELPEQDRDYLYALNNADQDCEKWLATVLEAARTERSMNA
ncbi:hypothetical protein OLMES_1343 [Oleiphilus messinensis]|uniref:Iminophenyl-pyruvate dimer synthase domain-containing protein n=1 Tax=Oleiphilus messinensis TaxID=141451 RepID=A0A1Y0I4T4_9GAMM|nr:ferritin-like protein [Oleiphilus messinensis]ARU55421.1 hypothetical protein OLMES_1343 [Oleiphilus messinensis]